jgi:hypothetical protein
LNQLSAVDGEVNMEVNEPLQNNALISNVNGTITRSLASEMNAQCNSPKADEKNKYNQAADTRNSPKQKTADVGSVANNGSQKKQKKGSVKDAQYSNLSKVVERSVDADSDHAVTGDLNGTGENSVGKEAKILKANKKRKLDSGQHVLEDDLSANGVELQTRQKKRMKLDSRLGSEKNGTKNDAIKGFAIEIDDVVNAEDVSDEEIEICIPHGKYKGSEAEEVSRVAAMNTVPDYASPQFKKSRKTSCKSVSDEDKPFLVFDAVGKTPAALVRRTLKTPNTEPQRKHLMVNYCSLV